MASAEIAVDRAALFEFLTRMGDNTLILGHRVKNTRNEKKVNQKK